MPIFLVSKGRAVDIWEPFIYQGFTLKILACWAEAGWHIGMSSASYTWTTAVQVSNPGKGEYKYSNIFYGNSGGHSGYIWINVLLHIWMATVGIFG